MKKIMFMGDEITEAIIFDATPGVGIIETVRYEEAIYTYKGKNYLRIYSDNQNFLDYRYVFVPIKRPCDHKNIDRNNLPKPYFVIEKGGITVYEKD